MRLKTTPVEKSAKLFKALTVLVTLLCSPSLWADGSRNLYPSTATGVRAQLQTANTVTANWPFPNSSAHYVYAQAGERITLASSAQGSGSARIRLIGPSGTELVNNTSGGLIANRAAELAGPRLFGQTGGNFYTPIYYQVPANGTGIYKVEFTARTTNTPSSSISATENWSQGNNGIIAWDISVINSSNSGFIPGRVYTNVMNLSNGSGGSGGANGFHGVFYTLTKDGYTYRVKNNGNNGLYFTFFVNNNGFVNPSTRIPLYKSLNYSNGTNFSSRVHNPNLADTATEITHKIFYTLPASDLPASATGAAPGPTSGNNTTWLKNTVITPQVAAVSVEGVEGTNGQVGAKGGYVKFNADTQGNYQVIIEGSAPGSGFVRRVLTGSAVAGLNQVYWDGKDGNDALPPASNTALPIKVTVILQGAEVHFPFIDMEYNPNGIIIELLNHNNLASAPVSDIVYWDDSNVSGTGPTPKNNSHLPPTNNPGNTSSNVNGHLWSGSTFGNEKGIDTWTFIKGQETTINTGVLVKTADLKIVSIVPDKNTAYTGDHIIYTVKVKNDGPSDVTGAKFNFNLPAGMSPQNAQFTASACGSSTPLTYNAAGNTYTSDLTLPNGCEVTITITVTVNNTGPQGPQAQQVEATILRTNDVTDPDATNPDINTMPTDAHSECANNGLGGTCNNILTNSALIATRACYSDPLITGTGAPSQHGITLLQRAGSGNDNWPMVRTSAHTVLESNTKGFVITRVSTAGLTAITAPQEGMMVYDTTEKCLKIYSDGVWSCFNNPACP